MNKKEKPNLFTPPSLKWDYENLTTAQIYELYAAVSSYVAFPDNRIQCETLRDNLIEGLTKRNIRNRRTRELTAMTQGSLSLLDIMKEPAEYELDATAELKNYNRWIAESFYPFSSGSLVEFGAGAGALSALFLPFSDSLTLVEPSPNLFKKLETKFAADQNVTLVQETLESALEKFDFRS